MTYDPGALSTLHQSQALCLRRVKDEFDERRPSGDAAVKGDALHEIIELFTVEQAAHSNVDPIAVVREVLRGHLREPEYTPDVVEDVVSIAATMFGPRSEIDFRLRAGFTTQPEWKWYLDDGLHPLDMSCPRCGGRGFYGTPPDDFRDCDEPECKADPRVQPAFAGAVDRLEYGHEVHVWDWKSTIQFESSDAQAGDKQAKWYAVAVLAHFPDVNEVIWHKAFLRRAFATRYVFKRAGGWHEATRARMLSARAKRLRAIETDEWPETPGPSCPYCPLYWNKCEAMRRRRASGVDPSEPLADQANAYVALKWGVTQLGNRLKAHVDATQQPIDLGNDDGDALGMKPGAGKRLVITYEQAMERLALLLPPAMSAEDRAAWFATHFRYVTKAHLASRVEKAAEDLVGRKTARGLLYSDFSSWLEPMTEFSFETWVPPPKVERAAMTPDEMDDYIDRMFEGG